MLRTARAVGLIALASGYDACDCKERNRFGNITLRLKDEARYFLAYDAESRLTSVSGTVSASFAYNGDGQRVTATIGTTITTYIGGYFEWQNGAGKSYYFAGAQRVAMRASAGVEFLLTDHLCSTAITATSSGGLYSELRYYPWGGMRYTYGTTPTSYRYTGQREAEVGLYYYGARFYDPQLGRFISPDTIIPQQQGTQAWDRYAGMNNNPMRYTDPSGKTVDDCNRAGANCGGSTYNQGLAWGQSDWEARGVSFSGRGWTSERTTAAVTALNGVRDAIGYHETVTLLGLDEEGLTLSMFLNPLDYAQGSNCPGNNSCFHADSNSIDFNPESNEPIVTWAHEIAHPFDFHAGGRSDYSTSLWIQSVPGWSQDMNGVWSFSGNPLDVASDYGLSDPREDYAETFTWHVFTRNGWNLPSRYREPSLVRQTELQESFR